MKRDCGTHRTRSQNWKTLDHGALPWHDGPIVEQSSICHFVTEGCGYGSSWERLLFKTEPLWGLTTVNSLRGLESMHQHGGDGHGRQILESRRLGLGREEYGG